MTEPTITVVIPTHNRHARLAETVGCLLCQTLPPSEYEIIVVDDGSVPPVTLAENSRGVKCSVLRLEGRERSAARNAGAAAARGDLLVFVDDDLLLPPDFLGAHLRAHRNWPDALLVGAIRLPEEALARPFVRFRQRLEDTGLPAAAGLTTQANFCAAGNMAMPRRRFLELNGFDAALASSEDQDLGLRHTATGGRIAFVPEARVVHCDRALDIRSYCRRTEWGAEHMIPFCRRYPDRPDNRERDRINGPVRWGQEPQSAVLRKLTKSVLAFRPVTEALFGLCWLLERLPSSGTFLERVYRLLLGAHLLRGYRRGLKQLGSVVSGTPPEFSLSSTGRERLQADSGVS